MYVTEITVYFNIPPEYNDGRVLQYRGETVSKLYTTERYPVRKYFQNIMPTILQ